MVNHDSGAEWTVKFDTIEDNGNVKGSQDGGALMMGNGDVYEYDCLTRNGEYGLNAADGNNASGGPSETVFSHNEVSYNGVAYFPDENCGCSGGIKYWAATNPVVKDNYIHDNYNVGLWFDTNNTGTLVEGNYLARNWAEGMVYEISYNADVTGNTFLDNGWGVGSFSGASDFPLGAGLYVNGSGGNSAVDKGLYSTLTISSNVFTDNWDGVVLYQNPNRVCGSSANSSTGYCTLDDPSVFTTSSCAAHMATSTPRLTPDYYDGCQWKTDNIEVTGNAFNFNPLHLASAKGSLPDESGADCYSGRQYLNTSLNPPHGNSYWCGFNGTFAVAGSNAPLAGYAVADALMGKRDPSGEIPDDIQWDDNVYSGPWAFQAYVQGQSPVVTDVYPHGVATTVKLSGWQGLWRQDLESQSEPLKGN